MYLSILRELKIIFKDLKIILWCFFSEDLQTLFKEFKTKVYQMAQKHWKHRDGTVEGQEAREIK